MQFLEAAQQEQQCFRFAVHLVGQRLNAEELFAESRFPIASGQAGGRLKIASAVRHSFLVVRPRIQVVESRDMVRGMGFLHR